MASEMEEECKTFGVINLQGKEHLTKMLVEELTKLGYKIGHHKYPFSGETVACHPHLHVSISLDRYSSMICQYNRLEVSFDKGNYIIYNMEVLKEKDLIHDTDSEEED